MTAQELGQHIWSIKESIRGLYDDSEVEDVILPFTLLRRIDCVLESKREVIAKGLESVTDEKKRAYKLKSLMNKYHLPFYNHSGLSLQKLLASPLDLRDNFKVYLNGFTDNVKDILSNFVHEDSSRGSADLSQIYARLDRSNKLFPVVEKFAQVDLSPEVVDNTMMGTIFEIVVRHSKEATNTKAGQFYTPREIVRLLVALTLSGKESELFQPGRIFSIYDPCCGTGGMLTEGKDYMKEISGMPSLRVNLYGQELNEKTYAICKSDLLMKGELQDFEDHVTQGNTLTNDRFAHKRFNFMLANPPFGMDWGDDYREVSRESVPGGRFEAGLPDKSDGSLLFLQHMISKMDEGSGSRIGIVLNGSPLFNGGAGSGWSNIRKMLLDRNLLDAIVALPKNLFYGTDISTYLWILDNNRPAERRNKVLFIDATYKEFVVPLQWSLGKKRFEISEEGIQEILRIYQEYVPLSRTFHDEETGEERRAEIAKILDYDDFLYTQVTIRRPMRLWYRDIPDQIRALLAEGIIPAPGDPKRQRKWDFFDQLLTLKGLEEQRSDYELFEYLKQQKVKYNKSNINDVRRHLGEVSESAPEVYTDPLDSSSPLLADTALNDTELIPYKVDISEYILREVLPFRPDAWRDESQDKIGCEFPFTKIFYEYQPLRSIDEVLADLKALESESDTSLDSFIHSLKQ